MLKFRVPCTRYDQKGANILDSSYCRLIFQGTKMGMLMYQISFEVFILTDKFGEQRFSYEEYIEACFCQTPS